ILSAASVILSEAKDLSAPRERPFAALRVTVWDCSNCQGLFFTIEPCLTDQNRPCHPERSICHPERSEGSVGPSRETLSEAKGDKISPNLDRENSSLHMPQSTITPSET